MADVTHGAASTFMAGKRGLVMGVALEFFALASLPFGATRYPEWGSASVVGAALFAGV